MEKRYKIGLFFILILIIGLVVVLLWKRHTLSGFPNEGENTGYENSTQNLSLSESGSNQKSSGITDDASQVQQMEVITTCDTICIYENIDKKDGSISMEEARIPAKYIGLKREELEAALAEDSLVPTLEEREKCFKSQHLELFSAEKIKILRIYDTTKELTGFYIMEVDGEICVYEQDKTTLYFRTGLTPENLPADVRYEVQKGKYMDTELQVYHFIESYSS
ncbi:MAG: hypothetical protein J6D08_18725 [Lachnospiraceae bacterium]|nr:hypothetical protein [Lachnospiraceae bacterium]